MAENNVSHIKYFSNESNMAFVEHNGEILFSSEEIGRQLGYKNPTKSVNMLFNRNQKELRGYTVGIKVMSTDEKFYEVRHFTEEGVYILSMLANTPRASDFRARLAQLLRHIRQEQADHRAALAHSHGYQQGLSEARALPAAEQKRTERTDALTVVERAVGYLGKGLTMTDAAALTGCPASTLRGRLNRVRKLVAELPLKYTGGASA